MKMNANMDTYKLESKSRKYLVVNREEVSVLRELIKHEIIHSSILHQLWRIKVSREYSKGSLSNRIGKLVEYDVLRREEEKYFFNKNTQSTYYYRIGQEGYELLSIFGFIDSYELFELESRNTMYKIPTNLNTSVSKLVNNIVYKDSHTERNLLYRRFLDHWFYQYPFSKEEITTVSFFENTWVMEDLIQRILVVESFSLEYLENIQVILNVLNKFAKECEKDDRKFSIIMGRVEEHTVEEGGSKGSVTNNIRKIKEAIPHFTTWHQNLNILVVPFDRLEKTIERTFGILNERKLSEPNFFERVKNHLDFLTNTTIDTDRLTFHPLAENQTDLFSAVYKLYYKNQLEHLIAVQGHEGSVKTYQKIWSSLSLIRNSRSEEYEKNPRLVLIYPDGIQQEKDIRPSYFQQCCQKTNFEELYLNPYEFLQHKTYLQLISSRRNQSSIESFDL